jgi:Zn-dependent protease with chaperone function
MLRRHLVGFACVAALTFGCVVAEPGAPRPAPRESAREPQPRAATQAEVQRLRKLMLPLLAAMDRPIPPAQVSVGILDTGDINAANAGRGQFFVTKGLLVKANDPHLMAILAHEVAHDDLNHVEKVQILGAGVGVGIAILDQIFPGSGAITPVAGQLVLNKYSRDEEYAADAHGAELLGRAGQNRALMAETLTWLMQTQGGSGGGFFATHPGTTDRIAALKNR